MSTIHAPGTGPYSFNGHNIYNPSQQNVSMGGGVDGNAMNQLLGFFGPPPKNPTGDASRNIWRTHEQFPAAYEGSSEFMGHVITGLVAEANDFLSTIIFPKVITDQIHYDWTITKFNQTLVPEVPHEGVGRVLEYTKESGEAHSVRRGQSIKLEFDFFMTQQGKDTYYNQVTQLTNNVIRTYQLDILHAIRNCHATEQAWNDQYGIHRLNVAQRLQSEVDQFACIPKDIDGKGVFKISSIFKRHAERLGFEIDAVLGRDIMMRWIDINQIKTTAFMWRGPGGIEQMQRAGAGVGTFGGLPFYPIKNYSDIYGTNDIGPMQSYAQIGEYNTIGKGKKQIKIFSEDLGDDDVTITRAAAWMAIHWNEIQKKYDAVDGKFKADWDEHYNKVTPMAMKAWVDADDETKTDPRVFQCIILLIRSWMKYRMESLVFMKAGESTGRLNMGVGDFSFSQNGAVKTLYCFYTYYSAAVCHGEKHVLIADNVHYDQYLGGCSELFISEAEMKEIQQVNYQFENIDPNNELFEKSMLAWPLPFKFSAALPKAIDITGQFVDDYKDKNSPMFPSGDLLGEVLFAERMERVGRGKAFQRRVPAVNTINFRGYQRDEVVVDSGNFTKLTRNAGHHGEMVYSGCEKVRAGQDYEYKQITYVANISV